jgi:hypothetical protein
MNWTVLTDMEFHDKATLSGKSIGLLQRLLTRGKDRYSFPLATLIVR